MWMSSQSKQHNYTHSGIDTQLKRIAVPPRALRGKASHTCESSWPGSALPSISKGKGASTAALRMPCILSGEAQGAARLLRWRREKAVGEDD